jgi:hypothetical protein
VLEQLHVPLSLAWISSSSLALVADAPAAAVNYTAVRQQRQELSREMLVRSHNTLFSLRIKPTLICVSQQLQTSHPIPTTSPATHREFLSGKNKVTCTYYLFLKAYSKVLDSISCVLILMPTVTEPLPSPGASPPRHDTIVSSHSGVPKATERKPRLQKSKYGLRESGKRDTDKEKKN